MATRGDGRPDDEGPRWTTQWHIAADGSVIHQRSRGDQPGQQLYRRYLTTRPVTLDDIATLRRDLEEHGRGIDRAFRPWAVLIGATLAAFFAGAGLLILGLVGAVGVGTEVGALVMIGSVVVASILPVVFRFVVSRGPDQSSEPYYLKAGFVSSEEDFSLSLKQTADLIRAPGTVSGPVTPGDAESLW